MWKNFLERLWNSKESQNYPGVKPKVIYVTKIGRSFNLYFLPNITFHAQA